jgi:Right handed beta helix region
LTSAAGTIRGIHIANNPLLPNNDGIDCIGCKDVHISDCDIHAGDDDFAFWGSEDVSVTGCSLYSRSSGIRLENTRYATFSGLSIHANRGIGIYGRDGITQHLVFTGITIETELLAGHWWGKGEPIFIAIGPARGNGKAGVVDDIRFADINGEAEAGIILVGDPTSPIRDLFLDHVSMRIRAPRKTVSDEAGGNFDFRWIATGMSNAVFQHDIPALYAHNVDGLHLHDFHLEWADGLPEYFSNAIECEDFKDVHVDGFSGRQAFANSANAVIALRRGEGVSINNSTATAGASTFVSASMVRGEGLFSQNDLRNAKHASEPAKTSFLMFGNALP